MKEYAFCALFALFALFAFRGGAESRRRESFLSMEKAVKKG